MHNVDHSRKINKKERLEEWEEGVNLKTMKKVQDESK
jgi:hypothetical protein